MPASNRRPLYTEEERGDAEEVGVAASAPFAEEGAGISAGLPAVPGANEKVIMEQPCTLKGLGSAAGAGILGYILGTVPAAIRHKGRQWALTHRAGTQSASQLALMSGLYTAIHCICFRLRQHEDGWNRGIAGCATGLALGFPNGPASALQSCIGLGAISALIDFGGGAAAARTLDGSSSSSSSSNECGTRRHSTGRHPSSPCSHSTSSSSGRQGCSVLCGAPAWLVDCGASACGAGTNNPLDILLLGPLAWLAHSCQDHLLGLQLGHNLRHNQSLSSSTSSSSSSSDVLEGGMAPGRADAASEVCMSGVQAVAVAPQALCPPVSKGQHH